MKQWRLQWKRIKAFTRKVIYKQLLIINFSPNRFHWTTPNTNTYFYSLNHMIELEKFILVVIHKQEFFLSNPDINWAQLR